MRNEEQEEYHCRYGGSLMERIRSRRLLPKETYATKKNERCGENEKK